MATYSNAGRRLILDTPLGDDALVLRGVVGREAISQLFSFQLDCLSDKDDLDPTLIVGQPVTITLMNPNDEARYFHGYIARFAHKGKADRGTYYGMEMVPWLWFLTRQSDCRIFQNQTIPEIVEQIFNEAGFTDFETGDIKGTHPKWEYCVQYRETDFNFISRLLEHEGIFYYFRHENGKHTLVLGDSKKAYKDCVENEVGLANSLNMHDSTDQLISWEHAYAFASGKFAQSDYNFKTPTTGLLTKTPTTLPLEDAKDYEIFDYPGQYEKKDQGQTVTDMRMEEIEAAFDVVTATSKCRTFGPAGRFKISRHASSAEENKKYVITTIQHNMSMAGAYVSGEDGGTVDYTNTITCIPDTVTYRPPRVTPKPVVNGLQSAIVTGPAGEEIFTDKYGRVKVLFYWDRYGKNDDTSSCFLRVAQSWAGKNWGTFFLPRIGMEVLVSFLEGDCDRPLITGCVYHDTNMPPYELPKYKTISTIKTYTSKGGNGFNELRFDDNKGYEQISIHAQKRLDICVKEVFCETNGADRNLTVRGDWSIKTYGNVGQWTQKGFYEEVDQDCSLKVTSKVDHDYGDTYVIGIATSMQLTVPTLLIAASTSMDLHSPKITGEASDSLSLLGAEVIVEAGASGLTLRCGDNYIKITSDGIKINGTMVKIAGSNVGVEAAAISMGPGAASPSGPKARHTADAQDEEYKLPIDPDGCNCGTTGYGTGGGGGGGAKPWRTGKISPPAIPHVVPAPPPKKPCTTCKITSETVATSPANRARTKIAVGEEVDLTVDPGPADWDIVSGGGTLMSLGSSAYFVAPDKAGTTVIKAKGEFCDCTISFTIVEPASWTQKRTTSIQHTNGRPDCGWRGEWSVHPDDVNFYAIEFREKDSQAVTTGSYVPFAGVYHGDYPLPDRASSWLALTSHTDAGGSAVAATDHVYSGDPGDGATGAAPPFTTGTMFFPITMQWRLGTSAPKDFPAKRQEHEIFSPGKCESRKGGENVSAMYTDPTGA